MTTNKKQVDSINRIVEKEEVDVHNGNLNNPLLNSKNVSKKVLIFNILLNLGYLYLIIFIVPPGNLFLYSLLIFGEIFHFWQTLTYIYTIWDLTYKPIFKPMFSSIDIFITVAGEPVEIVQKTILAAKAVKYRYKNIYILNDGYVAGKENWKDIEKLAKKENVGCITRTVPGGAKAGNINNALKHTKSEFIAIFDADHKPFPNFLKATMGYFTDPKVAFVQTPQYYENYQENIVTQGSWEQQELFFNPICKGKNRLNSTFMCGTNMIIRREALMEVGGMCEYNIAEDFLTSLFIHSKGWKSVYESTVLSSGLAPEDFVSYYKQQLRWARGSLEVIFKYNPIFNPNLSLAQKIQYLASASYYLSGIIVLIDIILPIIFLYTGIVPLNVSTLSLALIFIPYILLNIYTLRQSDGFNYTFLALSFSVSSFTIFILALLQLATGKKATFAITSKTKIGGNFYSLVAPQILYILMIFTGFYVASFREGINASVITNLAWGIINITFFIPFINAAISENPLITLKDKVFVNLKKQLSHITYFLF